MKKTIMTGIVASCLALASTEASAGESGIPDTVELAVEHGYTSLDTRFNEAVGKRAGFFVWNIATVDYSGAASNFTLVDTTYHVKGGLYLVPFETQFVGTDGYARTGAQYYGEWGNFTAFSLSTVGTPFTAFDPTLEVTGIVGYNRSLNAGVGLYTRVENITNVGMLGHNFSTQKLRLGVSVDSLSSFDYMRFGVSLDTMEIGNTMDFSYSTGAFVGVDF
jgi:hypothetical protein